MTKLLLFSIVAAGMAVAAPPAQQAPSAWWVHGTVAAHIMAAALDGLSSWKQAESNPLYAEAAGPQTGRFYRTGAARLAGITLSIGAVSEAVGWLKPSWRRYVGALNAGAAAAHEGVAVSNLVRNPYYR
ncbi:MAG: hypothetical protein ACLQVN_17445 [Bryobacteraceae bacterium]